jgi:hypothetical protein
MLLLPHDDFAVLASGDGAADEQKVLLNVDFDDIEILGGLLTVAMMASHALTRENASRISVRADRSGLTGILGTVRGRTALELVTLDGTREATALGGAGDGDFLVRFENRDIVLLADFEIREVFEAEFSHVLAGGNADLLELADGGLVQVLDSGAPEVILMAL